MKQSIKTFVVWIPFALTITFFCMLVYGAVQHDIRIGANDPQIQMAQDASSSLSSGTTPSNLVPNQQIDISKSLASYIIVYDVQGRIVASSANLHGNPPVVPNGIFDTTRQRGGELRFTWQPEEGVRQAVVLKSFSGKNSGFVLAGRSLLEIEKREDDVLLQVFLAWIVSLCGTFVAVWIVLSLLKTKYFQGK